VDDIWKAIWKIPDWSSLLGLALTVGSVVGAFMAASRAKTAADHAREVREKLGRVNAAEQCEHAVRLMDEIRRMHRDRDGWPYLTSRYHELKRILVQLKMSNGALSLAQKADVAGILVQFRDVQDAVEILVCGEGKDIDVPGCNRLVNNQMDKLEAILATLRQDRQA